MVDNQAKCLVVFLRPSGRIFFSVIPAVQAVFIHNTMSGMTINYQARAEGHCDNKLKGEKGVTNDQK